MGFAINTNTSALNSYRNLSNTQNDISKSLEKLSTGLRINRAADDAAGLSISEGLRSQVNGLNVAARNAQDGISVIQTAEGALTEVHSILQRMRDLAVQAGNDSNNSDARSAIKTETDGLTAELGRISKTTNFNGINLLDGSKGALNFQIGADGNIDNQIKVDLSKANVATVASTLGDGASGGQAVNFGVTLADLVNNAGYSFTSVKDGVETTVTTGNLSDTIAGASSTQEDAGFESVDELANALRQDDDFSAKFSVTVDRDPNGQGIGIIVRALDGGNVQLAGAAQPGLTTGSAIPAGSAGGGLDFSTADAAQLSLNLIDKQIHSVSEARSGLGASQNRLESAIKHINISAENLAASESRIRDVDMAKEMASFTKNQIMSQAGTAMLAQANQINQGVLQLLG